MKNRNLILLLVSLLICQLGHSQVNGLNRNTFIHRGSANSNRSTSISTQSGNNQSYSRNSRRSITNRNNDSQARNHTISQNRNNNSIQKVNNNNKENNRNSRNFTSTSNNSQNSSTTYSEHQFTNRVRNNLSTDNRYQGMHAPRHETQSEAPRIYKDYRKMQYERSRYNITNYHGIESSLDSHPTATIVTGYNVMDSNYKERFKAKMIDLAQSKKYGLPTLSENDLIVLFSLTKKERGKKMKEWASMRIVQVEVCGYGNNIDLAYKDAFVKTVTETCGLEVDTNSDQSKEEIEIFAESRILKYTTIVEDEAQGNAFVKINATVYNGPAGVY